MAPTRNDISTPGRYNPLAALTDLDNISADPNQPRRYDEAWPSAPQQDIPEFDLDHARTRGEYLHALDVAAFEADERRRLRPFAEGGEGEAVEASVVTDERGMLRRPRDFVVEGRLRNEAVKAATRETPATTPAVTMAVTIPNAVGSSNITTSATVTRPHRGRNTNDDEGRKQRAAAALKRQERHAQQISRQDEAASKRSQAKGHPQVTGDEKEEVDSLCRRVWNLLRLRTE